MGRRNNTLERLVLGLGTSPVWLPSLACTQAFQHSHAGYGRGRRGPAGQNWGSHTPGHVSAGCGEPAGALVLTCAVEAAGWRYSLGLTAAVAAMLPLELRGGNEEMGE